MGETKEANVFDERRADKGYLAHRHRLAATRSVVDHYPPRLLTTFYCKVTALTEGTQRLRSIIKDNKVLVQNINFRNRTKGCTDTHLRPYVRHPTFDTATLPVMLQLEKYNKEMQDRLNKTPAVYDFWELHREWLRNKRVLRALCRYPWDESRQTQLLLGRRWTIERMPTPARDLQHVRHSRPRVFLEFSTSERPLGRIEVVLYRDLVPATADNFLSLCRGDGVHKLSYRGTPLFRVNPGLYAQGGDVVSRTGVTNRSATGHSLHDERRFDLRHSGPGVLSMCCTPWCTHESEQTFGSQFLITFRALPSLDHKNLVFGKMARGHQTLYNIENLGTRSGKPKKEIYVTNCGEIKPDVAKH